MLTSKQRAFLRSLAQTLTPIFQVGKNEIGENMVKQISDALTAHELIKLHVLENSPYTAKEASEILCEQTGADCVAVIGAKIVLYRETQDKKRREKRIILPK
ncbi:MAG: ribosome assembly RNA-binding protein YhbY [Clostridia bacterium]|nr:ribosome assembly RNA-binding protein YhbY [Clostridia bacterium]